jgi:lysine decarboxylase
MPGHGYGRGFPHSFRRDLARMDITEVPGMDDLNHPTGLLREAQDRLAALTGADRSFFLVNGSSIGILSMMTALCRPGDTLIVPRASHRAVYHGLTLGGMSPVYLYTNWADGRPALPSPEDVEKVLNDHPQAMGMVLTSPDYWGRCADVAGIAEILHRRGKALLLDQAHGAHFGFHPALPSHGGMEGVDIWVQSAHKTLPALTQSAWLHIHASERVSAERVEQKIRLLQTTSPSYPMMASMDYARDWLAGKAYDAYADLMARMDRAVRRIEGTTPVRRADFTRDTGVVRTDPTRLVLDVSGLGMEAGQAEEYLLERNVRIEWAQGRYLVLICTPFTRSRDFNKLVRALRQIPRKAVKEQPVALLSLPEAETVLPMGQALDGTVERIDYRKAAGRVAGTFVIPYPPGVPLYCPGERVTDAHIDWIEKSISQGKPPAGVDGGYMDVLQ